VLRQRLSARPCGLLVGADCNVKNVLDIFLRDLVLAKAFYNEAHVFSAGPETRLTFDAFHEQGRRLNLLPSVGLDADEPLFVERTSTFRSRSKPSSELDVSPGPGSKPLVSRACRNAQGRGPPPAKHAGRDLARNHLRSCRGCVFRAGR
jgi:hypothetical protein